jgi:hypothetical protein
VVGGRAGNGSAACCDVSWGILAGVSFAASASGGLGGQLVGWYLRWASCSSGDPAALCRCTESAAAAPIRWYVAHMLGCLVSLAARLTLSELPGAVAAFQRLAVEHLPAAAFAQRTQAEAIRLGLTGEQAGP